MYPLGLAKSRVVSEHMVKQYHVFILTDCVSAGFIQYAHVALVQESRASRPIYAVAAEANALAKVTGGGSHFLCAYDDRHSNYGSSDDWNDLEKFTQAALRLIEEHFTPKPIDPYAPLNRIVQIIIVDDILETRENIRKLLQFDSDFEVVGTSANGLEGIAAVESLQPEIVLIDLEMPEMDGAEAAQHIMRISPKTKVIMMSIHGDADSMTKAAQAGAVDFLGKPIAMDELYVGIRTAVTNGIPTNTDFNAIVKNLKGGN